MTTLLSYAELAAAVYDARHTKNSVIKTAQGKQSWTILEWISGGTEGFQGAILQSGADNVCAFKGTGADFTESGKGTTWEDVKADLRLTFWLQPKQLREATDMVRQAENLTDSKKKTLSIVGHSLGGALAQGVGYGTGLPFVTFNAPGMQTNMMLSSVPPAKKIRGFNMILLSDPIGNFGLHVGKTERFITPWMFVPGPQGGVAHTMSSILSKLSSNIKWASKTIDELC